MKLINTLDHHYKLKSLGYLLKQDKRVKEYKIYTNPAPDEIKESYIEFKTDSNKENVANEIIAIHKGYFFLYKETKSCTSIILDDMFNIKLYSKLKKEGCHASTEYLCAC